MTENRDTHIKIRASKTEVETLKKAAEKRNMKYSEYVRSLLGLYDIESRHRDNK